MKVILCDNALASLLNFRYDVIRYFINKGWNVVLAAPRILQNKHMEKSIPEGCKVYELDMEPSGVNPINDMKCFMQLCNIYKREKPDIVIHYTIKPNIYGTLAARLNGRKTVAMVAGLGYVFAGEGLLKRFSRALYKFMLRMSHRVIVLNETNKKILLEKKFVKPERLLLFAGGEGVNMEKYPYIESKFDEITFLMIARVLYDKGYCEYVEAAKIVKAKFPNVRIALLGPLDETSPMGVPLKILEKDIADGSIEYLGITNDVQEILKQTGIVSVLPSYHEGMSRSLLEACAMGKPIIASNIPGCKEIVDDNVTGYLVPAKNSNALADAMIKFMEISKEEKINMSKASYNKAIKEFDVKFVLRKYEQIINELL